jgi:formylglycine-generating enzyme required for sulfatase activity
MIDIEWITIPGGPFLMGVPPEERAARAVEYHLEPEFVGFPQQIVTLDTFQISKYPITYRQYAAYGKAKGVSHLWSPYLMWGIVTEEEAIWDHPTWASWWEAHLFCQWVGGRLPSEAEWEKAARGTDGRRYPWGDEWQEERCNSIEVAQTVTSSIKTTPVRRYAVGASPYGVCDMLGNVWEWTSDWMTTNVLLGKGVGHPLEQVDPLTKPWRVPVLRGGSAGSYCRAIQTTLRFVKYTPDEHGDLVGFRCVRTPPEPC